MDAEFSLKVSGGKLVNASVVFAQGEFVQGGDLIIASAIISGDFFLYPEEKIVEIERSLSGARLEKKEIVRRVMSVIEKHKLVLVGISPDDIAEAVMGCRSSDRMQKQ
ncbi:hypothetical protein JXB31_05250 [Candidatus Woesearchaeota archaeon]|nr:hypothetical protein [Candidatus Woesearchaeota archaeon]